jgi:hypothetical protein
MRNQLRGTSPRKGEGGRRGEERDTALDKAPPPHVHTKMASLRGGPCRCEDQGTGQSDKRGTSTRGTRSQASRPRRHTTCGERGTGRTLSVPRGKGSVTTTGCQWVTRGDGPLRVAAPVTPDLSTEGEAGGVRGEEALDWGGGGQANLVCEWYARPAYRGRGGRGEREGG